MRLLCAFVILCAVATAAMGAASPPNVIILLADDMGNGDPGCYGARDIKTPNIDSLAASGIRFTSYYAAAPICSPSRAGMITGRYPMRAGMSIQSASFQLRIRPWPHSRVTTSARRAAVALGRAPRELPSR